MITRAESEQFLELSSDARLSQKVHEMNIDVDSENRIRECFSSVGDDTGLETMTFSLEKGTKFHKSKMEKKIEEFKLNPFQPEENKEILTCSSGLNELLRPKDKALSLPKFGHNGCNGVKDFSISRQALHLIIKSDEKKKSILTKVEKPLSSYLKSLILSAFHSHFLFNSFAESQKLSLLENLSCYTVEKAHTILQEGDIGECIYFIEEGSVVKLKKGKILNKISHQNIIGEEMILSINPMTCSYIALENCTLWGIDSKILAQIMLSMNEEKYKENRKFLEPLVFFSCLSEAQKDELASYMSDVKFVKGKTIIEEDEDVQNFFIIKEGSVLVTQKNKFLYYLVKGDSFGDNFFMKSKRKFTVKAESHFVNCLCINKKHLKKILGRSSDNMVINGNIKTMLRKSFFFSKISPVSLEKVFRSIRVECLLAGTIIQTQPDSKDVQVALVADGSLSSLDGMNVYNPGQILFEELFFDHTLEFPAELKADEESIIGFIHRSEVEKAVGMTVNEVFKKQHDRKNRYSSIVIEQKKPQIDVNPQKLFIIKEIGEGVSGLVFLVKYEFCYYALKIVSKGWIIENKLESYIRNEKKIHQKVAFPFITSMVTTWKDNISIYFLMEYIQGKELYEILNSKGVLEVSEIIYLAASLILTLEYLHLRGIIHRDLKPENIMINNEGCVKVCDLGFGKMLLSNSDRSYTIVGTHHYMSPEMILGKGYSFLVDYWSLGVILYESFFGKLPYGDGMEDPFMICQDIIKKKLTFPKEFRNKNIKLLIQQFLNKSADKRLGLGGLEELKSQQIFEEINWEKLLERKVESPFKMFMNFTKKSNDDAIQTEKYLTLAEVLENQDLQNLKEITDKLVSDYKDWDDIF